MVVDALKIYAEDMARKSSRSYPHDVVVRMVEQDNHDDLRLGDAQARSATAGLLNRAAAQGFRLGQMPVEAFVAAHPDVLDGTDNAEIAKQNVKTLQRVYQVTPSSEAIPVLMKLGLTSAYDIAAL